MQSFLSRYQNGDCEAVWSDMLALGPQIRQAPYHDDALAVARETMRRARANVETLIRRLERLGYRFSTSQDAAAERLGDFNQLTQMLSVLAKGPGVQENPHAAGLLGRISSLTGSSMFQGMQAGLQRRAEEPAPADPMQNPDVFEPPPPKAPRLLDKIEKSIGGPLPLSLRAWCEQVGHVSLVGTHAALCPAPSKSAPFALMMGPTAAGSPALAGQISVLGNAGIPILTEPPSNALPLADPLVVTPGFEELEYCDERPFRLVLAPDDLHKAGTSGDVYEVEVPNASADAVFGDWHNTTFVNYLRLAFKWGGFPGWERYPNRPEKELSYLSEGLLPI